MVLIQRLRVQGQVSRSREMGILGKEMNWNLDKGINSGALTEPIAGAGVLRVICGPSMWDEHS